MKNSAPNEENQTSTETIEDLQKNSQGNSSVSADDSGGVDLGEFVADTIELVSSFFDD